jgi:hypothetical protein
MEKIEGFQRIDELKNFYGMKVSASAVITEDTKPGGMSDDEAGQWAANQFRKAAKTLHLEEFVIPVEAGGVVIPDIQDLSEYRKRYVGQRVAMTEALTEALPIKRRLEKSCRALLQEVEKLMTGLEIKMQIVQEGKGSMKEEEELNLAMYACADEQLFQIPCETPQQIKSTSSFFINSGNR